MAAGPRLSGSSEQARTLYITNLHRARHTQYSARSEKIIARYTRTYDHHLSESYLLTIIIVFVQYNTRKSGEKRTDNYFAKFSISLIEFLVFSLAHARRLLVNEPACCPKGFAAKQYFGKNMAN